MALKGITKQTIFEMATALNDASVVSASIVNFEQNASGWIDVLYDDSSFAYSAGSGGGTVSVPADATVYKVYAVGATGSGTITIDGGGSIPVANGGTFDQDLQGSLMGAVDIVFSANLSYYVSWRV